MSTLQLVINGIVYSSVIVLGSIGLSLVYSIGNFANFAHGDTMAVGAFGALVVAIGVNDYLLDPETAMSVSPSIAAALETTVFSLPIWFFVALLVGMAAAAIIVVLTELLVYRPLNTGSIELLITSIGVALGYRALLILGFGSDPQTYGVGRSGRIDWVSESLGVAITPRDVMTVAITAILVVGLHLLLQYTTLGRKMRATADNADLARVSGIRTGEIILAMWVIGAVLAAAGGVFLGLDTLIRPRMGFELLLLIFSAVILGGIGSVYGAMLGGFTIGMAFEMTAAIPFVGTQYNAAVAFIVMIAILLVRPTGILGDDTT